MATERNRATNSTSHAPPSATDHRLLEAIFFMARIALYYARVSKCAAIARNRDAHSAEVELGKWFEPAAASIGKPRPEQVGKLITVNRVASAVRVTEYLAATQVTS